MKKKSISTSAMIMAAAGSWLAWVSAAAFGPGVSAAAEPVLLWQIGQPDNDHGEFALAPDRFNEFHDDGFFVIGQSDAQRDWPYVHPGPLDGWAGGRSHTFTIVFGLKSAPTDGMCTLRLDLLDTHGQAPPEVRILVNGREFKRQLPPGASDESVRGQPARGREHAFDLSFPAGLLKTGANEISLTTLSGSWLLYDWIGLETPPELDLTEASVMVVGAVHSPPMLVERDGQLRQIVRLAIRHFGPGTTARIQIGDAAPVSLPLRTGAQTCEVTVPPVDREQSVPIRVEVPGQPVSARTVQLSPVRRWVVYLLPHSHVDIGYTHLQTEVEQAQWKYLEMALDAAEKTAAYPPGARFKWNVEVLWAVDSYLRQATPEKRRRFIDAVQRGQIGLQALYGNVLTGLCHPEELLRLQGCAQRIAELCGTPITSAMITDVPGCTWGIVPALAHSGVRHFSMGPNNIARIGRTIAAWGDKPFWWMGPNGDDRALVWMTGTGYFRVFQSTGWLLDYLGRLAKDGYPYDLVQIRHCLGDNGAPDVKFSDLVRTWNEMYAYPKLMIATTDEMFRDFEQRYGESLPTVRGDFTPYWEDGAASSARETALNRAAAERLLQAETLFAMFQPQAHPADAFSRAWRNVILYNEHTWGAHNSVSHPDDPFVHHQWATKQAFALDADRESRQLVEAAMDARGAPVAADGDMNVIDVINTTSCFRPHGLVVVPRELSTAGDVVRTTPAGRAVIPSQRLTTGELVFRSSWPPFAGQRFYITPGAAGAPAAPAAQADGLTLASAPAGTRHAVTVRVDGKTGAIASLQCDGREYVRPDADPALNDYVYLPGSDLKDRQGSGPVTVTVKERGPLVAALRVESEAPGCRRLTREIRVHAQSHHVEIINTVDKLPVRAKEGVHFGFGFQVPDGVVRLDVPWGVVRPETDQIPGACKNWFTVQRWVDVSNEDHGITMLTPDAPLVQIGGITANLLGWAGDPRLWLDRLEPSQTVYSWVMNNHWFTNYRAEQEGPTIFRFLLRPHGKFDQRDAMRFALEHCQPLALAPACGEPPAAPRLQLSGADVLVTAFKASEDGRAWIVRLFGVGDQPAQTVLRWSEPAPRALWLSDTSEKPLRPLTGPVTVPPFGIVTVRAELP
jgi:alpha-mannosidase